MATKRSLAARLPRLGISAATVVLFFAANVLSAQTASNSDSHPAFTQKLVAAGIERTSHRVRYEPAYVRIPYPNGDVPADTGVCTDEIIRS